MTANRHMMRYYISSWLHQLSSEALQGNFREWGEWGQKVQGAGSMASKRLGSIGQNFEGSGERGTPLAEPL